MLRKRYFTEWSSTRCQYGARCALRDRGCLYNHDDDSRGSNPSEKVNDHRPRPRQQSALRGNDLGGYNHRNIGFEGNHQSENELLGNRQPPRIGHQANHQQTLGRYRPTRVNQESHPESSVGVPPPVVIQSQTRQHRRFTRNPNYERPGLYQSRNYRLYLNQLQEEEESIDEQERLNRFLDQVEEDFRRTETRRRDEANGRGRNAVKKKEVEEQYEQSLVIARYGPDEEDEDEDNVSRECHCIRCLQERRADYELQLLAALHPKADWDLSEDKEPENQAGPSRSAAKSEWKKKQTKQIAKAGQNCTASAGKNANTQTALDQIRTSPTELGRAQSSGNTEDAQILTAIANTGDHLGSDQYHQSSDAQQNLPHDERNLPEPSLQIVLNEPPKRQRGKNQARKQSTRPLNQNAAQSEASVLPSEKAEDLPEKSVHNASAKASKPGTSHHGHSRKARKGVSETGDPGKESIDRGRPPT